MTCWTIYTMAFTVGFCLNKTVASCSELCKLGKQSVACHNTLPMYLLIVWPISVNHMGFYSPEMLVEEMVKVLH